MAPEREPAVRAARDRLPHAALGRRIDELGLRREPREALGFDQRVERKGGAGFALAPAAMAAVDEKRRALQPVADCAAVAAAFAWKAHDGRMQTASPTASAPSRSTRA